MCGLVAVFSKAVNGFSDDMRNVFTTLVTLDTLRGEDSTGAMMIRRNGDVDIAKEASTGSEFLTKKEFKDIYKEAWTDGAALIGHNRKATKGWVSDENAHPFVVDDKIVLVHNGGIFGDHKQYAEVDVDSHAIAHLLAKYPIPEALGKFYGAYALIWYDVEQELVQIIRNKERPLWWMETNDAWYFSSEKIMLQFAANRCGLKLKEQPTMLDEDTLITFKLRHGGGWINSWEKITLVREWKGTQQSWPKKPELLGDDNLFLPWAEQMQMQQDEEMQARVDRMEAEDACAIPQDRIAKGVLVREHTYTVGSTTWEKTSDFERDMAKGCNKIITMGEFNRGVVNEYQWSEAHLCEAFEFIDDGDEGYFIYASPVDDPNVIFRHHFGKLSRPDHHRMMQMALSGWKLKLKVDKKSWSSFDGKNAENPHQDGYCIITSSGCVIVEGGPYVNGKRKDVAYEN